MSFFRWGHDEWDRMLVNGLSWELLPLAFWAAVVIVIVHAIVHALTAGRRKQGD